MTTIQVHEDALDSLKEMAQKTLEQRDMLLAALKFMVSRFSGRESYIFSQRSAYDKAQEAIAKVEAEPPVFNVKLSGRAL